MVGDDVSCRESNVAENGGDDRRRCGVESTVGDVGGLRHHQPTIRIMTLEWMPLLRLPTDTIIDLATARGYEICWTTVFSTITVCDEPKYGAVH